MAEDSATQAEQLRFLLEEQGYAVTVARNGREALASARNSVPDLLISDVNMPEMGGYELCRTLKADAALRDIPLMLVTSMTSPYDVIQGLDCGADNFITKPYDESFLIARINYLLTNSAIRSSRVVRSGIEIDLEGRRHFITAERQQILDLLISTYAAAVRFGDEARARDTLLRESAEIMTVLYGAADGLNQARNEEEVIRVALDHCKALPFVQGAWLWLTDESHRLSRLEDGGLPEDFSRLLSPGEPCACRDQMLAGSMVRACQIAHCDRLAETAGEAGVEWGHASIPLLAQSRQLGLLNVIRLEGKPFPEKELTALSALGNQIAAALDRARLHDLLEQRVAERTARLRTEIAEREGAQHAVAQTAARLERAFRGSNAGIWEWNVATDETYYSPRFAQLLGFGEGELAPTIESLVERIHPEDREAMVMLMQKHLLDENQFRRECRLVRKDGTTPWFALVGIATHDAEGRPEIMSGSIIDVSNRRNMEEQLRQVQKMEAIGNLTGGIAHDFNNMLAVVIGNLDLLRLDMEGNAEACELLDSAINASLRGADLTKSLLAFARRQPLQPRRLNPNELLRESLKLIRRAIGTDIEVALDLHPNIWEIFADGAQLEAALLNLMVNARDAMPHGGRILVGAQNVVLDGDYVEENMDIVPGDYVVVSVSDTGHGIPPELMARVFEPFFTTKDPGKGTGLGLAMVFGFVKQTGGQVKVYSEVGHGTTMRLYLPRADSESQGATDGNGAARRVSAPKGETILVVEDNPAVRQAAVKQLNGIGYRVVEAENAAAALDLIEQGIAIDLLFTDVVMPGAMTGTDLAQKVAARWPDIRILLTSGFPQGLLDGNRLPSNIVLLGKPYRMDDLFRKLRELLDSAHN